jgi:hypothetical protein
MLDLSSLKNFAPASITEYKLVNDRVAQVIVNCSKSRPDQLFARLHEVLGGKATPIRASFRWLVRDESMIGFVATNQETQVVNKEQLTASFRLVANSSNIYMNKEDDSIWELRNGTGGTYLSKTTSDDLGELIESVRASRAGSPRMASIMAATVQAHEVVAFVYSEENTNPDMEYGFCVGRQGDDYLVVTANHENPVKVSASTIVGCYSVDQEALKAKVNSATKAGIRAGFDKKPVVEYYKKAYSYDKQYLATIIKQIEEQAAL